MKRLLTSMLCFCAVCLSFAQADRVVMTINGEKILASEYYQRMEFLPNFGRMVRDNVFEATPPGLLTMQLLLEERIILQCATENGVPPSQAQTQDVYDQKLRQDPNMLTMLEKQGLNKDFLMYQCRIEAAQFNLVTMGVNITDLEIEKYYKGNPREFTSSKKLKLRVIAVPDGEKAKVDDELKSGKSFAEVAKAMSKDATAAAGGDLGEVAMEDLTGPIIEAIEKVKIGQYTEWVQGENIVVRFLKENVIPPVVKKFDDDLKKRIRRNLMIDRGAVKNDLEKLLAATRKKAKIEVLQPQFRSEFAKFMQRNGIGQN